MTPSRAQTKSVSIRAVLTNGLIKIRSLVAYCPKKRNQPTALVCNVSGFLRLENQQDRQSATCITSCESSRDNCARRAAAARRRIIQYLQMRTMRSYASHHIDPRSQLKNPDIRHLSFLFWSSNGSDPIGFWLVFPSSSPSPSPFTNSS